MALLMLTLGASSSRESNTAQAVEVYKNTPALEGEARWRLDKVSGSSPLVGSLEIGSDKRRLDLRLARLKLNQDVRFLSLRPSNDRRVETN
jgi:hypothetical protein